MDLLHLTPAAQELGISRSTLKRWIHNGQIKSIKTMGGHHRIPRSEIERLRGAEFSEPQNQEVDFSSSADRPHVLFVDDVKDTRDMLEMMLNSWGYDVTTATEATEALALAQDLLVDAYVLDNMIPGNSGIDLCLRIRETDPDTPVFFYSGFDDRERALKAQAQAYIIKPNYEELKEALDSYFRKKLLHKS